MGDVCGEISKEEVIRKLKDDGDFDKLRFSIIHKLKENEELRSNIVAIVKQSAALNHPGSESMKPRQLSDAIFDEVRDNVMNQISNNLWEIIRSEGGMKSEIRETVESVYNKLANPQRNEEGEAYLHDWMPAENGAVSGTSRLAGPINDTPSNRTNTDPEEPPGFSVPNNNCDNHHQQQHIGEQQPSILHQNGEVKALQGGSPHSQDEIDNDAPPGFNASSEHNERNDDSDEDPDVPPGFG